MNIDEFEIVEFDDKLIDTLNIRKISTDKSGWRIFYSNNAENFICFYPFSEIHGGGNAYLINIKKNDWNEWIKKFPNFETETKFIIMKQRNLI